MTKQINEVEIIPFTPEEQEILRKAMSLAGKRSQAKMTPKQRSKRCRKAGLASAKVRWGK